MKTGFYLNLLLLFFPLTLGCGFADSPSLDTDISESGIFTFDFQLDDIDGNPVSSADFIGKVVVADIWGTWCPPCRKEIPHFVELQDELGPEGLQIVGITDEQVDDAEVAIAQIRAFTETQPINYPVLLAKPEVLQQVPDFEAYPTTIFIDRKGNVRLKIVGYSEKSELESIIKKLLAESP